MTYALLFEIAWKSFFTSGLTLVLLHLLANRTAGERSWIGHAGLLATLLLPLAVFYLPDWQVETPAILAGASAAPIASVPGGAPPPDGGTPMVATAVDGWALSFWVYAALAMLLLLTTAVAVLRLFALRRRASVLVEPHWLSALAHAQRRMNFKSGTALLVSRELSSPVSWGLFRPIILLNEAAVGASRQAEAILAHELAHVARLDWAKLILARAAVALFWFNPFVWMLARACHQLREEAADDAVLRSDVSDTEYAELLVGAARHENRSVLLAAHGVAPGRGSLKRRVLRILDQRVSRAPARIGWISVTSVGAVMTSVPLFALTPVEPIEARHSMVEAPTVEAILAIAGTPAQPIPAAANAPEPAGEPAVNTVAAAPAAPVPVVAAAPATRAVAPVSATVAHPAGPSFVRLYGAAASAAASRAAVQFAQLEGKYSIDDLVRMKIHAMEPGYAREFAALGGRYAKLSSDELVALHIQGVRPAWVRGLSDAGYRDLAVEDLTALAIHGVRAETVRGFAAAGYPSLSVDQLVALSIHDVSPAWLSELGKAGYDDLSVDDLIKLRIHDVRVGRRGPPRPGPGKH